MWRFCHTDMSLGLLVHGVSLVAYLVATGGTTSRARVHMVMIIFMSDQVIGVCVACL